MSGLAIFLTASLLALPSNHGFLFSDDSKLIPQIVNELTSDKDFANCLEFEGKNAIELARQFRIKRVDINQDKRSEIVVEGVGSCLCSPTGNCFFRIYRKKANEYELLLEASTVQQFYFKKSTTKGYRDVVTAMHGSAFESDLSVYKFDGKQYQLKECLIRSYSYPDKHGRMRIRKRPQITRVECQ